MYFETEQLIKDNKFITVLLKANILKEVTATNVTSTTEVQVIYVISIAICVYMQPYNTLM